MPVPKRLTREQSRAQTREKLLAAAYEVVALNGYEGASIDRIAETAGFSKGAFYSNFASKEDILLSLLEENAGGDVVDLDARLAKVEDPQEVIAVVRRWSDERSQNSRWGIIAIEFMRRATRDDALSARQVQLFVDQWEGVGRLLIAKLMPANRQGIRPIDLGGIVLELTYGGISAYLGANSSGMMVEQTLRAVVSAEAALA